MNKMYWELIVKKLNDTLSREEDGKLQQRLEASPENREVFRQAEKLLERSERSLKEFEPETDTEWLKLKARITEEEQAKEAPVKKAYSFKWWHAAAGIALLAGVGFFMRNRFTTTIQWVEISATDSIQEVVLTDSSHIWLNRNTTISYPEQFADNERVVKLNGEAYFKVQAGINQPFKVQAGKSETEVVGTSFNVKAYEDDEEVEVSVDEGKVTFTGDTDKPEMKMSVKEGHMATYNKKTKKTSGGKHKKPPEWLKEIEHGLEQIIKEADKGVKKLLNK